MWIVPMMLAESFGQNRGEWYDARPSTGASWDGVSAVVRKVRAMVEHTSVRASWMDFSRVSRSSASTLPVSMTSGMTLAAMRIAMKRDAMGSNPVQPYSWMSSVETITPTEPSVSWDGKRFRIAGDTTADDDRARKTYCHDVQEDAAHVVTVALVRMIVHVGVVVQVWGVRLGVVRREVVVVPELVAWRERRDCARVPAAQMRVGVRVGVRVRVGGEVRGDGRVHGGRGRHVDLDFERLVSGVEACACGRECGGGIVRPRGRE